jgi:hypothetical protein
MSLSLEQLVENALIEAFPGQSQAAKNLYRYELESWVSDVMLALAMEVINSPHYHTLQRTVTLPLQVVKNIEYCRFGPTGMEPQIKNGVIFGSLGSFAASDQQLPLSGSPLRVRSYFIEWQSHTPLISTGIGLINPFRIETSSDWLDLAKYALALRITTAGVDIFNNGANTNNIFGGAATPGDIFRWEWDAAGALSIKQYDADRTLKNTHIVVGGGNVADVVTPAVITTAENARVSVGLMGDSTLTAPADGVYRAGMEQCRPFVMASIAQRGRVIFDLNNSVKLLSYAPSLAVRALTSRCDQWYWSLDGEQIIVWAGEATPPLVLPATSIRVTGNIIPLPAQLPPSLDQRAVDLLVAKARMRLQAATPATKARQ